jgi:Na+:H+ antiporter, NhaA family
MKLTKLFIEFFNSEKAAGLMLVLATIVSLILANSALQTNYLALWKTEVGGMDLVHWINDLLMAIFFLMIGLELEREIYAGELSNIKKASLPIFAATGGMFVPAAIYIVLNFRHGTLSGAGIPMATDIAFAIGILSLLGNRVPGSLKIFLTALAVMDDLGAIIIIAIFYSGDLHLLNLIIAISIFIFLIFLNRLKVHSLIPYIAGGAVMWYLMLHSGVHPTLAGVLLAFAIPFGGGGEKSPSFRLQHSLHRPVAYLVLPLFALANTAIPIEGSFIKNITEVYGIGIIAGLVIGKPLGIFAFSAIAAWTRISELPGDIGWRDVIGVGFLGGIGFTMSIFIAMLAFDSPDMINGAKAAILVASLAAGTAGFLMLRSSLKKIYAPDQESI